MAASESACIFARTRAIESARTAFGDLGFIESRFAVLLLELLATLLVAASVAAFAPAFVAVSTAVAALVAPVLAPPALPAESRHAPITCTVSPRPLSPFVFGAIATRVGVGFLGTGTDPLAHCSGTVNPDTESRLDNARRAADARAVFAESAARDARASLAL